MTGYAQICGKKGIEDPLRSGMLSCDMVGPYFTCENGEDQALDEKRSASMSFWGCAGTG